MIYLQEIFEALTYGELSNLSMGGSEEGEINEGNYPRVINHISAALTALYKRFPLKESRLRVLLLPEILSYSLNSKYALANTKSAEPIKYIVDTAAAPFRDDILKVERAYTNGVDEPYELSINDENDEYSLFMPTLTTLEVHRDFALQPFSLPDHLRTGFVDLAYRADHPKIILGTGYFDPAKVEIQLTETYKQALLYYVASRANNPAGMTNEFHAGNSWYAKYEAECQSIETYGLKIDQMSGNSRLRRTGWV